jgi:hypothetical protein
VLPLLLVLPQLLLPSLQMAAALTTAFEAYMGYGGWQGLVVHVRVTSAL